MPYPFVEVEKKWQKHWADHKSFCTEIDETRPKYYVLDMFPYPSGAGLHVGHPLGYIASDIYARFKRLKGFNVLHPMGYDAFGLPAEQYAIQTNQHPAITTSNNTKRYREQLDKMGLSYDWDREVATCDPEYYKWTQWIFTELFKSWYDLNIQKSRPIEELIEKFSTEGNANLQASNSYSGKPFDANFWNSLSEEEQQRILLSYRLAYIDETFVNWCPKLGTVLANDEVRDGLSVRGGHPVEQKKMKQWFIRVSAYAQRLLDGLEKIDWTDSLKEIQRNWIGRSEGATIRFSLENSDEFLEVYTTRPDTMFGVSFIVIAPESEMISSLVDENYRKKIEEYQDYVKKRTEMDRIAETKSVTGEFTGRYAIHPVTNKRIPIWTSEYVLANYGTGMIMAVPGHDSRDYSFAKKFDLDIIEVVSGGDLSKEAYESKEGTLVNSDFLNGLEVQSAIKAAIKFLTENSLGEKKINYRLRDAIFSRQRYWGEPIPIYYKNEIPYPLELSELPLTLPTVDKYLPTETGHPPLGRAKNWKSKEGHPLELTTMPGFAGSSAYYLRYLDPQNNNEMASKKACSYWQNVDLYVGGIEHATGHLIYSRVFNKFLFDRGYVDFDEPFKKLINQGMIQGQSQFVYRIKGKNSFVSYNLKDQYDVQSIYVDVNIVHNNILDREAFKSWREEFKDAEFILEEGNYLTGNSVEKMSKSLFNVVNPDFIIEKYGADTLRLYEMFLGPIEQSKPWSTSGIEGVYRFLNKVWKQCFSEEGKLELIDEEPTKEELKIIHTAIKKVHDAIESFSHNTAVSALMICLNDLVKIKSKNKEMMRIFTLLLAPMAPHICEEIWEKLGATDDLSKASFPTLNESYLVESVYNYPISVNGKLKFTMELSLDLSKDQIEKEVLSNPKVQGLIKDETLKKIIIVPKKIVNLVL